MRGRGNRVMAPAACGGLYTRLFRRQTEGRVLLYLHCKFSGPLVHCCSEADTGQLRELWRAALPLGVTLCFSSSRSAWFQLLPRFPDVLLFTKTFPLPFGRRRHRHRPAPWFGPPPPYRLPGTHQRTPLCPLTFPTPMHRRKGNGRNPLSPAQLGTMSLSDVHDDPACPRPLEL